MSQILVAARDRCFLGFVCRMGVYRAPHIRFVCTTSGIRSLEMLQRDRYSLGIVDQELGDLCGLELIRRARRHGVSIPLIFVVGVATRKLAVRARRLGAHDLLEKPVLSEQVEALIRDYVSP